MSVQNGEARTHVNGDVVIQQENNNESVDTKKKGRFWTKWCRNGCRFWCRKYFWEGQLKHGSKKSDETYVPMETPFTNMGPTKRKVLSVLIPAILLHICWWSVMIKHNLWYMFKDKYFMTITMIFGSIIAGMTSEGGGAIAFPVMTLAFSVKPAIARDFSVMIQSFGMTAAAFSIFFMKIQLEYNALIYCSIGGAAGAIIGLELIDPNLTAPQKKMGFVSIWFAFAFSLFLLNWHHKRRTFIHIPNFNLWKKLILLFIGVVGGMFTSFAGSGLDICSFSILTLLFRVSEKVATPTSVILMAGNTLVVFFWRGLVMNQISNDAWQFLMVCIPIVVFGAPFGSFLGTHFHRLVLAACIYIIDTVALASAFAIVPQTPGLAGGAVGIIVAGFVIFLIITKAGERILNNYETTESIGKDNKTIDSLPEPQGNVNPAYDKTPEFCTKI